MTATTGSKRHASVSAGWLLLAVVLPVAPALHIGSCNATLGLESGTIEDGSLSASSSFDDHSTGPQNARLNHDRHGGAWCPKPAIAEDVKEWLQVDLGAVHVVTGIVTQGRYGKGKGQEYLEKFMVEYRRGDNGEWRIYADSKGKQIFNANSDTVTASMTVLDPPVFASTLRLIPYSVHPRIICLRFELHGCKDQSGIVSYSAPPPDLPGSTNVSLRNVVVGKLDSNILHDGHYGDDVMRATDVPNYDKGWMGWKRRGSKPIELVFHFDSRRIFTNVVVFSSNRLDLGIQVFRRAVVWILDKDVDATGTKPSATFEYMPDIAVQESRNVTIPLVNGKNTNNVGSAVRIQLFFANVWMLVSEVNLQSFPASEAAAAVLTSEAVLEADSTTMATAAEGHFGYDDYPDEVAAGFESEVQEGGGGEGIEQVESSASSDENSAHLEVIIGVLSAVTLLLLSLFVAVLMYSRRQKLLNSPTTRSLNPFPTQLNMKELLVNLSVDSPTSNPNGPNNGGGGLAMSTANITNNPNYASSGSGETTTAAGATSFYADPFADARGKWHSTSHVPDHGGRNSTVYRVSLKNGVGHSNVVSKATGTEYASVDVQDIGGNGSVVGTCAIASGMKQRDRYRSLQAPHLQLPHPVAARPPLPPPPPSAAHGHAALLPQPPPPQPQQQAVYNLGQYFPRVASEPPQRKHYQTLRGSELQQQHFPLAPTAWNLTTSAQGMAQLSNNPEEIDRGQLRAKKGSLGGGKLGREVVICEVDSAYSNIPRVVAVRTSTSASTSPSASLSSNSSSSAGSRNRPSKRRLSPAKDDLARECRLLASLHHHNVTRLVGVVTHVSDDDDDSEIGCHAVLEHSTQGDLCTFLRSLGEAAATDATGVSEAVYVRLVEMCGQVAAGMRYLEARNIVHKDLAARNCILSSESSVLKITDVAMGMPAFSEDYVEVKGSGGRVAPIRWQAWETTILGRMTSASNAWSFGVTCWEILGLCRHRPFNLLSDDEVVQNAERVCYNDALQIELWKPACCDPELWSLLEECWSREEQMRPSFAQVDLFFRRRAKVLLSQQQHKNNFGVQV